MPPPKEVTSQRQFDDIKFLPFGGTAPVRVVEFFVGTHGPFRLEFDAGTISPEAVNRKMEETVKHLRETGAIT